MRGDYIIIGSGYLQNYATHTKFIDEWIDEWMTNTDQRYIYRFDLGDLFSLWLYFLFIFLLWSSNKFLLNSSVGEETKIISLSVAPHSEVTDNPLWVSHYE